MTTPRIALVTGASRGIGRAIALKFASEGLVVAITYQSNAKAAQETVAQLCAFGQPAFALQADLSRQQDISALFDSLRAELTARVGSAALDVLVNNAGRIVHATIDETTPDDLAMLLALNVQGPFFVTQHALSMLRDGGRIINIGTGLTRFSMPEYIAYSTSKGAIDTFTQVLAQTLGPRQITVNTVAPGIIETDMNLWVKSEQGRAQASATNTMGRVGQPEDIADLIAALVSEAGRWVTGQRIEASGGQHL